MKIYSKTKVKNIYIWCFCCVLVFLLSFFIHECGHGFANMLQKVPCSTGFNRVGDIYKFPKDPNFRAEYSMDSSDSLLDFGVPATLLLAIAGTILFYFTKNRVKYLGLVIASTNSLIRLIPCLFVVLTPLLTGAIHNEDEYGTGLILHTMTGWNWIIYMPAILSIVISLTCMILLFCKLRNIYSIRQIVFYESLTIVCFYFTLFIANYLDNILRINWKV